MKYVLALMLLAAVTSAQDYKVVALTPQETAELQALVRKEKDTENAHNAAIRALDAVRFKIAKNHGVSYGQPDKSTSRVGAVSSSQQTYPFTQSAPAASIRTAPIWCT